MKKEILFAMLVVGFVANSTLGMESTEKQDKIKMFHCTSENLVRFILKEGLKSKSQLAREGKAKVSDYKPTPDHYDRIFFQYIDEKKLKKVEPSLWKQSNTRYCVAIEVDPDKTMVYNPDLRLTSPFNRNDYSSYLSEGSVYRKNIYKQSGMLLRRYIAKKESFDRGNFNCPSGLFAVQHPFDAEPMCVSINRYADYTPYCWNEYTVKTDRIDPSEFAQ